MDSLSDILRTIARWRVIKLIFTGVKINVRLKMHIGNVVPKDCNPKHTYKGI